MNPTDQPSTDSPRGWDVFEVWKKYEDIAMHFNDLLIRLRIQALGGVAALSTILGIFTKTEPGNVAASWEIAMCVMAGLTVFWIAIWALDIFYYNRLLIGSAAAIIELEGESKSRNTVDQLYISTKIAEAVEGSLITPRGAKGRAKLLRGVFWFYGIVACVLASGFVYCLCKYIGSPPSTLRPLT
jgi:hypothetical protein